MLKNVTCTGSEARLVDCPFGTVTSCSHSWEVGVRCLARTGYNILTYVLKIVFNGYVSFTDCEEGDIRLVGGTNTMEGRVEVCYSGVWGTVCNNRWGRADAAVACRQLEYSSSGIQRNNIIFTQC